AGGRGARVAVRILERHRDRPQAPGELAQCRAGDRHLAGRGGHGQDLTLVGRGREAAAAAEYRLDGVLSHRGAPRELGSCRYAPIGDVRRRRGRTDRLALAVEDGEGLGPPGDQDAARRAHRGGEIYVLRTGAVDDGGGRGDRAAAVGPDRLGGRLEIDG